MNEGLEFLREHGYSLLFAFVLVEQLGAPIPAAPVLLAAGALAGAGHMNLGIALVVGLLAAIIGDFAWFEIGRRRGGKVLQFLCRISLEPDSCVRNTEGVFAKYGAKTLLVAKFVPGLTTAAPPLAGVFQMRPTRFLLFDALGAVIWLAAFLGLGYAFSDQAERWLEAGARLGGWFVAMIVAALAAYLGVKFWQRQRFIRSLRIARITPEDLKRMIDAGEEPVVVDLRHSVDFEADPEIIPGATHMAIEALEEAHASLPRDRDIVLYCT